MANWIARTAPFGLRCWRKGDVWIIQHAKRIFWAYATGKKGVVGRYATLEEAQEAHS